MKRPRATNHTGSDSSSSRPTPPSAANVLLGRLLDHVDDVVEGDDADEPIRLVHHRRGDEVVVLEQARHVFLVVGDADRMHFFIDQFRDRHRPLGAQQPVERDGALQPAGGIDHVEFPEAIRQIGRLAQ